METAVGMASWLLSKVLNQLSDDLVGGYVASKELGLNSDKIKEDLMYMQGLLDAAQERDLSNSPGLKGLLEQLSKQADEAEDALDELHYFMILDQLDGTDHATPDLGVVQHGRNAARHAVGNWLSCFSSCCRAKDATSAATSNPETESKPDSSHVSKKLIFDRVGMSNKIKSVMEAIHSKCDRVCDLLKLANHSSTASGTTVTIKRTPIGSTVTQKMYGRDAIFGKTIDAITNGAYDGKNLSVIPIVGPGGMGKTTFAQHLYNDERTKQHYDIRVWLCVSNDFDVLRLTREILNCILGTQSQEGNNAITGSTNLAQLQEFIKQRLKSKRFLIVLDDIWKCSSEDWDQLLAPFAMEEAKGNMVLVTTRFPYVAEIVKTTDPIELQGLEPEHFFTFFETCIFDENRPANYEELIGIARCIAEKLKCSPLAAKTVGRLLKRKPYVEHWEGVLENNGWKNQKNVDDIMPSLRVSYDYLPFHPKKCFLYLALFPEDYRFYFKLDITYFWIAIGIIDKDENYMEELVDNGFLMKGGDHWNQYYVMHDLLHELSQSVSSQECLSICSLSFRAGGIPKTIRHLSINVEDRFDRSFEEQMDKLKGVIDIRNLRTLMIFRKYNETVGEIIKNTLDEVKSLRVLYIEMNSTTSFPKSFPELIHLQYLEIVSFYGLKITLPSTLSRFYHLKFLNLRRGSYDLPKDMSRLVKLHHFLADKKLHSNVPEIGKMKHLQELKEFHVKKESVGFELKELGELTDLGGELSINIEKVAKKGEAIEAKLISKKKLKVLVLFCDTNQVPVDADVLDGFEPNPNLRALTIKNHGGATVPRWLCPDITIENLEFLSLVDLFWNTLPPFVQLPHLKELHLERIARLRHIGPDIGRDTDKGFMHLKVVRIVNMPDLEKWVVGPNFHLFPRLEDLRCRGCPKLLALPFSEPSTQDIQTRWYPNLRWLEIAGCPRLFLPAMPPSPAPTYLSVVCDFGSISISGKILKLHGDYNCALALHNLDKMERMVIKKSKVQLMDLRKLTSLVFLRFYKCESMIFLPAENGGGPGGVMLPQILEVDITKCGNYFSGWPMGGDSMMPFHSSLRKLSICGELSMPSMALLSNLTSLTRLTLLNCKKLKIDGFNPLITINLEELLVYNRYEDREDPCYSIAADMISEVARTKLLPAGSFQLTTLIVDSISDVLVAPICSRLSATLKKLGFHYDHRVEIFTVEQEQALELLTSLYELTFGSCEGLQSLPEALHNLPALRNLLLTGCSEIRTLPKGGFPTSLKYISGLNCSAELREQLQKFKESNPDSIVNHSIYTYIRAASSSSSSDLSS